jgi:hypothetical protein
MTANDLSQAFLSDQLVKLGALSYRIESISFEYPDRVRTVVRLVLVSTTDHTTITIESSNCLAVGFEQIKPLWSDAYDYHA